MPRRTRLAIAIRLAVAVSLATVVACSGSTDHTRVGKEVHRHGRFPAPRRLTAAPPDSIATHPLPAVGVTQQVQAGGAAPSVTLRRVIEALNDSGAQLPPASRAVGVIVQIRSVGPKV